VLCLYQDWAVGLLVLKLWCRLVLGVAAGNQQDGPRPPPPPGSWRERLAAVTGRPLTQVRSRHRAPPPSTAARDSRSVTTRLSRHWHPDAAPR
jgi:hypothetical protein